MKGRGNEKSGESLSGNDYNTPELHKAILSVFSEQSGHALLFTNDNNIVKYVNESFCTYFEKYRDQLIGNDLNDLFPMLIGMENGEMEYKINGVERYYSVKKREIHQDDGFIGYLYSISDVSKTKSEYNFLKKSNQVALELSSKSILKELNLIEFCRELLEKTRQLFEVDCCSLWRLNEDEFIECVDSSQSIIGDSRIGLALKKTQAPDYFRAILDDQIIDVQDVESDARTKSFYDSYSKKYNVRSLLDLQVVGEDGLKGILCLEDNKKRDWSEEEKSVALNIASIIANAIANDEKYRADRRANEKFRTVSEISTDYAYSVIVSGNNEFQEEWEFGAFREITGYNASEYLQKIRSHELFHPDDLEIIKTRYEKLINGQTDTSQFRIKHKEGYYLWIEEKGVPVYDALEKRVIKIHEFGRDISNLKRYIKRLENTQNELSKAYELIKHSNEVAKIGSWEIDLNTNKVYWDKVMKDIHEVPQDYMPSLEETINFYLPGKDRENIEILVEMLIKAGHRYDVEQQIITANKKLKWVRGIGIPLMEGNKVKRAYGLLQDIDEKKKVQIEIEKLSLVASKVHNSVIITDAKGRVDWVNDAFYTLTGYTLEEVKGKTLGNVLQGKDTNPEDKEKIKKGLKRKEPFTQEILNYTKTGKPYWNELSVTPIFNGDGVLTQFFGIQNDITKRKRSEAEIEKLSLVASYTQHGVVITDINGCSVWVNDSFLSLSGYSKKEVLGKKPGELLQGPDTDPQHVQKIRIGLSGRKPFTQEILNYNKKNEPYWIELSINPIFDKKGNLIQFIGIQNNISDRKKKEHDLEKALEEKNTLFKELHHRVKNNLNMVSNLLYLKSKNTNDHKLIEFIKETTNRIYSISKTHDQLLKLEEINQLFIKDYVRDLVENLVYSYCQDTKRYQVEYSIEDIELHVDKVLTIGLLTNEIISNTLKHAYSVEQTGVVFIDIRRKNDQVIYTIGDKGKGIKEEQLDFNNSLGLKLIKMFVIQLQGQLELDTANGVQYRIIFPFQ